VLPENESIARFSLAGADLGSATPFRRPSIYPLNHIAVDPGGPRIFGVTTHRFGEIDLLTGEFQEILIEDESLPRLSWPGGIAFDTRRQRIFITSRGHRYSYYPETGYWEVVADSRAFPIVYSPTDDMLYGIAPGGDVLRSINMRGAVVGETVLTQEIPMANSWEDMKVQLRWSSDRIVILASLEDLAVYTIDPSNGEVVRHR
jgi:hypothetical protein